MRPDSNRRHTKQNDPKQTLEPAKPQRSRLQAVEDVLDSAIERLTIRHPNIREIVLPREGFVRLKTILLFVPVSPAQWWRRVKTGEFPQPVRLGERSTGWRATEIHQLIERIDRGGFDPEDSLSPTGLRKRKVGGVPGKVECPAKK